MSGSRNSTTTLAAIVLLFVLVPTVSHGGAFLFAGEANGVDVIAHPTGYTGSGGTLNVTVCIDPSSANASAMEIPVQNIVNTYNGLQPTTGNLVSGGDNNVPSGQFDFESVALHEIGHCIGMAHPNLASESGLPDPSTNATKTTDGANNVFNVNDGADDVHGSSDDSRSDDVNLHWFRTSNNNPFTIASPVDSTTYARDITGNLPGGHSFVANADRAVATLLGAGATEAVMQQGTPPDEAQRTLGHDDVATLSYGMSGNDELAGTGDDYTINLSYAGMTTDCDIVLDFDNSKTAFAVCLVGGAFLETDHIALAHSAGLTCDDGASGCVWFNTGSTWFFNDVSNGACSIDADLVLNNQSVGGTVVEEACETITATNYTVQSPGDATFRAGSKIILGDGFNVQSGGSFVAEIDPGIN